MAIYIGLGANLDHPRHGSPRRTLSRALSCLADIGVVPRRMSRWYRTSPVPPSGQSWYINVVAEITTGLGAEATLAALHRIEDMFGRVRTERDAPRWIDLDLLDYDSVVISNKNSARISLPHPRMHERAFVLLPLAELAPQWRHPVLGEAITALIARLPTEQQIAPLSD
ncbi:2-amino-4-hydroxy-6-hydroxymethyldihydropteridine diphosphokinase [Vineibacter terrae]|uniref:2-amino-4-hydroxy-6-hydroxymethyldihydropteridine pyrophosphokinase n=1 Tax=Vineibacter terrae TaxID=2586908 RepID=A0A5C8PAA0_9HYPH|nr:2-amino-4-hydroxy-6-hydroxymethyldihydropteridine diphosphokinase [Vineibacter terrae]TXL70684.1 2-amino-4-hydroxy-6-hydroxymethyldihydropteridine diphosphokinase [Vineibacter terrae]